ncbi:hypothetical protein ACFYOT_32085 [Saccharothrix saharensis]|uniref:hypothetical protein n=1 Tax=Saccharothrix saharensis TaxID=571190 RepID=UPI0036CC0FA1
MAIDVLRHFSWFAKTGWENRDNTAGIWRAVPQAGFSGAVGINPVNGRNGSPSYLTLAAPDKKNFSTVFINDSEWPRVYRLRPVDMAYQGRQVLKLCETRAADAGERFNADYLRHVGNVNTGSDGTYTITVKPYSMVTATTLPNIPRPAFGSPLPVEGERTVLDTDGGGSGHDTGDDVLYADDFDYRGKTVPVIGAGGKVVGSEGFVESRGGPKSAIPLFTSDRNGAFEAHLPDGSDNYVLRQQVDQLAQGLGGAWNPGDPVTRIGDNRWLDYQAGVDVSFENNSTQSGKNYAAIGVRQQHGDKAAPYKLKFWFDGAWQVLVEDVVVAGGNVATGAGGVAIPGFDTAHTAWHNLALKAVGNKVTAYLDGTALHTVTDAEPKLSGRVELGSGYYHTRFDNLRVRTVDDNPSNYAELLDNLETHDLGQTPAVKLRYGGSWSHRNGTNMYDIQRTLSTSQGTGSTLTHTFTGTGLDLVGQNNGSAVLEVTVDGTVVHASAATVASPQFHQTYALRGLANGEHTVQVKVVSGTLVVDAVGVVAGRAG